MNAGIGPSADGQSPTSFELGLQPAAKGALLHIRASPLSPRIPVDNESYLIGRLLSPVLSATPPGNASEWSTQARLVFEPLILRAIPRTTLRTIGLILAFAAGAVLAVPRIMSGIVALQLETDKKDG